jgi:DNA invertase Pin-like site-specific DNA recombinase
MEKCATQVELDYWRASDSATKIHMAEEPVMLIGLARTSTLDQEAGLEAQKKALTKAGVEKLFIEQTSSVGPRPVLEGAIEFSRDGDVLVATDLSRVARSVMDFCRIQARLAAKGVELRVLNIGMDTSTPTGKLMLNVVAAVAQFEREMMLERQREGVAKAKAEKRYKGRAPTARAKAEQVKSLAAQNIKKRHIALQLGISERSVFRILSPTN